MAPPNGTQPSSGRWAELRGLRLPMVLCALFLTAMLALGWSTYSARRAAAHAKAETDLATVADMTAEAVSLWARERRADAQAVSHQLSVNPGVLNLSSDGQRTSGRYPDLVHVLKSLEGYDSYQEILLTDLQGHPIERSGMDSGLTEFALSQLADLTARTRTPQFSDVYPASEKRPTSIVYVCTPIFHPSQQGGMVALVVLTIDLGRSLSGITGKQPRGSASAGSIIVVRNGNAVRIIDTDRPGASGPQSAFPLAEAPLAALIGAGFRGVTETTDPAQTPLMAAITDVPDLGWQIVTTIELDEVYGPVRSASLNLLAALAALTLAALFAFIAAWRHNQFNLVRQQQEAEAARHKLAISFEYMLENMQEGFVLLGEDWTYLVVNDAAARHRGKRAAELIGRKVMDIYPEAERSEVFAKCREAMMRRVAMRFEASFTSSDGSARWYDMILTPAPEGVSIVSIDVTERKSQQEQLLLAKAIIDNSSVIAFRATPGELGKIVYLSGNSKRYGYRPEDVIGRGVHEFVHPDDVLDFDTLILNHGQDGAVVEQRVRTADGTWRWVETHLKPWRSLEGTPLGMEGLLVDIDDWKAASALKSQLASIVETSIDAIVSVDLDGRILTWNKGAEHLFGYAATEIIGRNVSILVPPDRQAEVAQYRARALAGGGEARLQTVRTRKDGIPVDVSIIISPIRDAKGNATSVSIVCRDIGDRRKAEAVIRRTTNALRTLSYANEALLHADTEEELFNAMCKAAVDQGGYRMAWVGLAQKDEEKTVRPVAFAGYEAGILEIANISYADTPRGRGPTGSAIRESVPKISHAFAEDSLVAPWREAAMERGYGSGIALPLTADEGTFGALVIYSADKDAFGSEELELLQKLASNIAFGVETLKGKARQAQAENELFQSRKLEAIGRITGELAHDFNNVLGIILSTAELGGKDVDVTHIKKRFTTIRTAATRAADVTKSLLAVARRQRLSPTDSDVNLLTQELLPLLRTSAGARIEIKLELSDAAVIARVDTAGFNTAMLNLVINARDAMPKGGTLTIRTMPLRHGGAPGLPAQLAPGDYVLLEVSDTGSGMTPEVKEQAFEPFFTTKPEGHGSGLGLSAIYGFVNQLGGTATIESAVGEGTTVRLYFRRASAALEIRPTSRPPTIIGGLKLLVVEDEPLLREALAEVLEGAGFVVESASDAGLAQEMLDREPFDILITDMTLPGPLDGIGLAAWAAGKEPTPKILLISGFASRYDEVDILWPVLDKPFSADELLAKIEAIKPAHTR